MEKTKQEIHLPTVILSGLLGTLITLSGSFYIHNKLLPIYTSNLVITEESLNVYRANVDGLDSVALKPVINNIGQVKATDIKFRVYTLFLNKDIPIGDFKINPSTNKFTYFGSLGTHSIVEIVQDIEPGVSVSTINLQYLIYNIKRDKDDNVIDWNWTTNSEALILIFHLEYTDSLNNNRVDKFYFLRQLIGPVDFGPDKPNALLKVEYPIIKDRLIEYLNGLSKTDKSDIRLMNYLKKLE